MWAGPHVLLETPPLGQRPQATPLSTHNLLPSLMTSSTFGVEIDRFRLTAIFTQEEHNRYCTHPIGLAAEKWLRLDDIQEGGFGKVWVEEDERNRLRAVKKVKKTTDDWSIEMQRRELQALVALNEYSNYFVRFLGWYENEKNLYIAMEFIKDGDLHSYVGGITEGSAKIITKQLLEGLKIMHGENICHRDLKPENVLVASYSPIQVKIVDFGLSKTVLDGTALRTQGIGTKGFQAPEIYGFIAPGPSEYTDQVDIWSLGCLVYYCLTARSPFPDRRAVGAYADNQVFPRAELIAKSVTQEGIDFMTKLLRVQPSDRLTIDQALAHTWLAGI